VRATILVSLAAAVSLSAPAGADTTVPTPGPPASARHEPDDEEPACGSAAWKTMARGLERWCATEKRGEERRGCRHALPLVRRCDRSAVNVLRSWPSDEQRSDGVGVEQELRFDVRDPRNGSFAWLWRSDRDGRHLRDFRYQFDDCDGP
jgi:hypothetical protein